MHVWAHSRTHAPLNACSMHRRKHPHAHTKHARACTHTRTHTQPNVCGTRRHIHSRAHSRTHALPNACSTHRHMHARAHTKHARACTHMHAHSAKRVRHTQVHTLTCTHTCALTHTRPAVHRQRTCTHTQAHSQTRLHAVLTRRPAPVSGPAPWFARGPPTSMAGRDGFCILLPKVSLCVIYGRMHEPRTWLIRIEDPRVHPRPRGS